MKDHVNHLRYELEVLKSRIESKGTDHIHTAMLVLENRIKEIAEQSSEEVLDSSYPDGDGYWK